MIGQVLSSIPIIGPLLGGLFGGGQPAQPPPQAAAASPNLAALAPLLGQLGQAAPGALGPLGAALPSIGTQVGASTAGAFLAGQLNRAAEQRDPQAQAGLQELGRRAAQDPITQNQERVARETIRKVRDELGPELDQIKRMARERSLQVQATAEHRELVAREEFRREVIRRLDRIEGQQRRAGVGRRF